MKKRSFLGLLLDVVLTIATGGIWLLYLVIKYLRNNTK
nr:MAG TPA: hypothetical protein [Caudoviricetes sp.]